MSTNDTSPYASAPEVHGRTTASAPGPDPSRPHLDPSRPFMAHIRTRWWAPILVIPIVLIGMFATQLILTLIVAGIEHAISGRPLTSMGITPLMLLGVNLSLVTGAIIALVCLRWIAGVPWRGALASGRRFSWGRLGRTAAIALVVVVIVFGLEALAEPLPPMALTANAVALIIVTLLTTPLQAAAEEIMYRGVIGPLVGSWIRPATAAVVVGVIVSSLMFGMSHFASDPWLIAYYVTFGLCGALMAVITRGLESSIAFHAVNNTILFIITALSASDQGVEIDRSAGQGGPFMLVFMGMDLLVVASVWLLERRHRSRKKSVSGAPPVQNR